MALIVLHGGRYTSAKFGRDAESSERSVRLALRSEDFGSRLNVPLGID